MFREFLQAPRRLFRGLGGALFLIALMVYLPGIWWGITHATAGPRAYPWGSDELAPLQSVTELYGIFFARQPHFNPQYPPFHNFVQALFLAPYLAFLWLTGGLTHPQPVYPFGLTDPVSALRVTTYLARGVSWLMGAGVVLAAFRTGEVMKDRLMGLICGLMALFLYPMFYYSRVSNVDMGALFWTALGLYVFAVSLRDGLTSRRAVWLALFAAFATASKDASWPAFLMMGVVLAYRQLRGTQPGARFEKSRPLITGLLVAAGSYAVVSGVIFRPGRFLMHLRWISGSGFPPQHRVPITIEGYSRLIRDIVINLVDSLGTPVALCVVVGLILCVFRNRLLLNWALPALGVVLLVLFPARFVLIRYVIVIAYVLLFFAAFALREAFDSAAWRKAAPLLLLLAAGWSLLRGADLTWQMLHDGRYAAGSWLHQHAQPGDRVLHFAFPANLPPLDAGVKNVRADASYRFQGTQEDPEFVILIPFTLFPSEPEHEPGLSDPDYQALRDGTLGYQQVVRSQGDRLFARRPIPWVNPLVQLFVRKDLLARRPNSSL
jgi:hypothetical protein